MRSKEGKDQRPHSCRCLFSKEFFAFSSKEFFSQFVFCFRIS